MNRKCGKILSSFWEVKNDHVQMNKVMICSVPQTLMFKLDYGEQNAFSDFWHVKTETQIQYLSQLINNNLAKKYSVIISKEKSKLWF